MDHTIETARALHNIIGLVRKYGEPFGGAGQREMELSDGLYHVGEELTIIMHNDDREVYFTPTDKVRNHYGEQV